MSLEGLFFESLNKKVKFEDVHVCWRMVYKMCEDGFHSLKTLRIIVQNKVNYFTDTVHHSYDKRGATVLCFLKTYKSHLAPLSAIIYLTHPTSINLGLFQVKCFINSFITNINCKQVKKPYKEGSK